MEVRIAAPVAPQPSPDVRELASTLAAPSAGVTRYRVTAQRMAASGKPRTRFMHSLPSTEDRATEIGRRVHDRDGMVGVEVIDGVFESPASVVFHLAENRMRTIKAVLVSSLGHRPRSPRSVT